MNDQITIDKASLSYIVRAAYPKLSDEAVDLIIDRVSDWGGCTNFDAILFGAHEYTSVTSWLYGEELLDEFKDYFEGIIAEYEGNESGEPYPSITEEMVLDFAENRMTEWNFYDFYNDCLSDNGMEDKVFAFSIGGKCCIVSVQ